MGPKKRNVTPRAAAAVDGGAKTESPNLESSDNAPPSSNASIKVEYERALSALRRGNHAKALKWMNKLCSEHENLALIHHVMGNVCVVASNFTDSNAKQGHLKKAIESARKSITLSPNSIEFSQFYANLLLETVSERKDYEEVVQECERALAIENPTDPANETLQEERYQNISSSEARVAHVQNELRSLIEKSNIASVSTRMKNLGNEDEKFGFIPMELRSVMGRRPNEIKKATKTPEERRQEIEVRVTAARLLQRKSESPQCSNSDSNEGLDSSSGMEQREGGRSKSGNERRYNSLVEIRDRIRSYWNSLDLDQKKELLRIRISDLRKHCSLLKEGLLDEALSFGKENKAWKFWLCYHCNKKFVNADKHRQHVIQEHMGTLLPEYQSIIPKRVEDEWAEMLLNCSWKPLDLDASIMMLNEQSKFEAPNFLDESNPRNHKDDSSPGKMKLDGEGRKKSFLYKNWPSTDDSKCAELLESIHAKFQLLIQHNHLASSHHSIVIQYAAEVLQRLPDFSQLLNFDMDQTPLCICFLGAPYLEKILTFLQIIEQEILDCEKWNFMGDSVSGTQIVDAMEKITFNLDNLVLEVDECFLHCKLNSSLCDDDSSSATSSRICYESNDIVLDSDVLLSWIFIGPSMGELLVSWACAKEEKEQQGKKILQLHEKKFYDLQSLCGRKSEQLNYEKALHAVDNLCHDKSLKREYVVDSVPQSYGSVLRKRREELIGSDNEITVIDAVISNRFELEAIANVLKDAESGDHDDWRTKDNLHQVDSSIKGAICRQKDIVSLELNKVDARILHVINSMQQLEVKLDPASVHDFRSILVPLVKSYLQARLEDLAAKEEATKKSDAARETLLAELAVESEQGFGGGGDKSRHMQERMKVKKKRRENRKNKDLKATGGKGRLRIHDLTSEEISPVSAPDAAIAFAGTCVALRQWEEEYERQNENEEKLKHLAEPPMSSEKENDEVGQLGPDHTPDGDQALPSKKFPEIDEFDFSSKKVMADNVNVMDMCGPGLKNEVDTRREAVAPTSLRVALSNLHPDSKFFQEGQMNDASEVLWAIFDCLHQSFPCEPVDMCPKNSFDELLYLVETIDQLACDPEVGGCRKLNYIQNVLSAQPFVFTIVLGWQNDCESVDDITATLAAFTTEIDISVPYRGLDQKCTHRLVFVVCFYGQHYVSFAYKHDHEQWIMYDDETVEEIGGWNDVLNMCERGHLQPQVFFFEALSQEIDMGHKKRNYACRSKASQPPTASPTKVTTSTVEGGPNLTPLELEIREIAATPSSSNDSIKIECQPALAALHQGNHKKALQLMEDLYLKHENSAWIHHAMGKVCVKMALMIEDPNAKQQYLKKAIESARKSVTMAPHSFDFSVFYANLLFETANGGEYEEVEQECQRAMEIASQFLQTLSKIEARVVQFENEVQSLIQKLNTATEFHEKISTPKAAVAPVQNEEGSLIQKSNVASISTSRLKNLGYEEEKFPSFPTIVPDKPMELRSALGRRPNEIKKATKNHEELRKEIDERVAAARLLQHKSESPLCGNDSNKGLDSSSQMGQRVGKRRKKGKGQRNISSAEIRDFVRSYWNSMNLDSKKKLLKVNISDLKLHSSLLKEESVSEVLHEALSFVEENKVWKFWLCCCCNKKFSDADSHRQHVKQEHMRTLSPKLQLIIPDRVDNEWAEMLLNFSWKPLDLNAAIRMLEDESNARNDKDYSSECKGDSSPEKNKLSNNCQGSTQESKDLENIKWMNSDEYQARKRSSIYKNWPSTDDSECEWLLARIHATFELLIKHNYLASNHLSKVIDFAVEQLQGLADDFHLLNYNMDQTPLCICFLSAPNLEKIMTFLGEILRDIFSFPPGKYSDKSYSTDDSISCTQVVDTTEKTFALDDLVLVLDELFLPCKLNSSLYDDSSSATSLIDYHENNNIVLDSDAVLSWIYSGPSSGEILASWTCAREEKVQQCKEILQLHDKEFYNLQGLCEIKCEDLNYEEALHAVNDLCCKERIKREQDVPQRYDCVLIKRREELIGSENGTNVSRSRFELDVIENVLKDAESAENGDMRTKYHLHQVDSCIKGAIQRRKEQASIELSKNDARILRVVSLMQQLEVKLNSASAHDFRSMFVHLVKSYLRTHLEDLAEKEATKKSNAAGEALLAELALDSEQGFGGGCNNSRHMHERIMDKKNSKKNRRNKYLKATGGEGMRMIRDLTSEMTSHIRVHDWDDPDAEVSFAGTDVALGHQKEEYKHRIELKFEERKLEENLKYERQIENEAKEKHPAEQPVSSEKDYVEVGQLGSKDNHDDDGALLLKKLPEMDDLECSSIKVMDDGANVMDIYGPGLKNKAGEYNCFLNVIIQSLWHLRHFRDELLRTSIGHIHAGDPCVTCALYDIFTSLSIASTDTRRESVAPRSLRVALSNWSPDSKFFQEGQMNDASEVLGVKCPGNSFDELLNLVEMSQQLACDPEVGGCGKLNYVHRVLSAKPHVFITVLGWQNTCESADDIITTLAALTTEIDISVLYRGHEQKSTHCLVSVVCYYGLHYCCFAYQNEHEKWIMYDDETVKVIGSWNDVLAMCERGHMQPQVLFFEAVN
ncbi:unnamed protein product [Fraxinus pennsylvanica]|uniref:USP domain-containing protein n=1 Tax=Fraxinus pennsylvanica TaxID=56036 RepID=A0AAD2EE37_9LAMI|nr:unnamed protein product [Fraxinus pennsylvanica]